MAEGLTSEPVNMGRDFDVARSKFVLRLPTLLHQGANGEPERIADCKAIFEIVVLRIAWIGIAPFVR